MFRSQKWRKDDGNHQKYAPIDLPNVLEQL